MADALSIDGRPIAIVELVTDAPRGPSARICLVTTRYADNGAVETMSADRFNRLVEAERDASLPSCIVLDRYRP